MSLHKLTAGDGYQYLIKQVAANDSTVDGGSALADYYSAKGESPGLWLGSGLACLEDGPQAGDQVSGAQMRALFGEGRHPDADRIEAAAIAADVSVKEAMAATKLGREFAVYTGASEFRTAVAEAFAAHNQARGAARNARIGEEMRAQIRTQVARDMFAAEYGREPADERELSGFVAKGSRQKTTAVAGYDTTFSPVKSVSTLWAVAPREVSETIEAAHDAAVRTAIGFLEEHACKTRIGTDGVAQIDADGLLATAFTHRDSRAGDPDLHTHVAISNKVRARMPDGSRRWLALDGRMIHKLTVAASEVYNTALEAELRERLGVQFAERDDAGNGKRAVREIVGVDHRLNEMFSSRRVQIEVRRGELAAAFQRDHGREPTPIEAITLAQQANLETRAAKHEPRSHAEQRATWRHTALEALGGEQGLAEMVRAATFPSHNQHTVEVDPEWIAAGADRIISTVSEHRARWQYAHVVAEAHRIARAANLPQKLVDPVVASLVATALSPAKSVALGVRDEPEATPDVLRRRNGESVYVTAGSQTYTSESVLAAESRIVAAAVRTDGRVASEMDVELALLEQAANRVPLNAGQTALVRQMATSGARVQLALAPAGTGKTTAMAALARAWGNSGGDVLGLAPTAAAAAALRTDLGATADTMGKLIDVLARPDQPQPDWVSQIGPDTLVVVDEAGMASTSDLDRVVSFVLERGGSVRLVGDDQQLASVAAGGVLRDIDATAGSVTLNHVVRFKDPAEGAASLALRAGDPAAIGFYLDHQRVHVSDRVAAEDAAYAAWKRDRDAGLDAVMLAPTRDAVKALNQRSRTDRLAAEAGVGSAVPGASVWLADDLQASAGDVICTRRNDRRLMLTTTDFVRNGDRWTLNNVHPDGSVTATRIGDAARTITLPAEYVREHVTLGYARTIHGAQGITAATCHVVATGSESRQLAYVALTRGKQANHLYLGTAHDGDPETVLRQEVLSPPTAVDVLTGILGRDGAQKSATTTARELADPATRLAAAAAAFEDAVGTAAEHQAGAEKLARIDAGAEQIHPGLTDAPAYPVLRRRLAALDLDLELDGTDPIDRLRAAAEARDLATAADPAAVLDWRLDPTGGAGGALVPWLPKIPMMLTIDADMDDYLGRRRDLVDDLATQVHERAAAWDTESAPRWARPLLAAGQRELVAEIAVARAAFAVPDADRRPTGPVRATAAQRRAQQRLDARAAEVLGDPHAHTGRWQSLADELDPRITGDPYWPELAERFTHAHHAGVDVPALAQEAVNDRPLPDELPAAALWWRLCDRLTAEGCDATGTTDGENPQAPPVLTPQQVRDGLSVSDSSRTGPAAAAGTVVAERRRALEHATAHLTAEVDTFVLSQDPKDRATQIRDYAQKIRGFYEQRARTLLGELLPDHNMRTLEADTTGWRQVTRQVGRTDMAERDTAAIVLTAVKELQKVGKAKGFDQAGNTPARVLARQIAAARGPVPERTDELQHIGLLLPPPHTNPATSLARTAKAITTAIRDHTDTAERDQPTWVAALGDPGKDPRRHRLRREVIEAVTSHRMFTGTALEDPDPMGGVHPDTNGPLRDAITAINGRHYRADHARMSDQELTTVRSLASSRLVESRMLLASDELWRAGTPEGDAALTRKLDALETHPHIQRELADLAAIDAEQCLRKVPGYTQPIRNTTPTRPAPAATTSNFTYDMGFDQHRDTGYGL